MSPIHDQGHGGQGLALFALDSPARSLAQNRCSKNKGGREAGREGGRERGRQGGREAGPKRIESERELQPQCRVRGSGLKYGVWI